MGRGGGKYFFVMTEMCASIENVSTVSTIQYLHFASLFFVSFSLVNFHHFHFEFLPLHKRCAVQIFAKAKKIVLYSTIYNLLSLLVSVRICNVATLNFSAPQKYANKSAHATCESICIHISNMYVYILNIQIYLYMHLYL